jgi:hypothetical protein
LERHEYFLCMVVTVPIRFGLLWDRFIGLCNRWVGLVDEMYLMLEYCGTYKTSLSKQTIMGYRAEKHIPLREGCVRSEMGSWWAGRLGSEIRYMVWKQGGELQAASGIFSWEKKFFRDSMVMRLVLRKWGLVMS